MYGGGEGWELVSVLNQNYRRESDPTALFGYTIASYFLRTPGAMFQAGEPRSSTEAKFESVNEQAYPVARSPVQGTRRAARPETGRHDFLVERQAGGGCALADQAPVCA